MLLTALLGLAIAGMVSAQSSDITIGPQSRNFQVTFNGNSGSFKLYLNSNSSNVFYNIRYMGIEEYDSSGNRVGNGQQRKFDLGNSVSWQQFASGPNVIGVIGSASQSVQNTGGGQAFPVTVSIRNTLTAVDNTTTIANVTVPIVANTLKISVNVTGWTTAAPSNVLRLWTKMSSNQNPNLNPAIQDASSTSRKVYLTANGAYSAQIVMENYAYVQAGDGGLVKQPVAIASDSSSNQQKVDLPGSSTGATVFWDPVLSTVGNGAFTAILSAAALLTALVAGAATLF